VESEEEEEGEEEEEVDPSIYLIHSYSIPV
jgi:hypothetical protein